MYTGKLSCAGCGLNHPRELKDRVCRDCKSKIDRANTIEEIESINTNYTKLTWYELHMKFKGLDWDTYKEVDHTFRTLLGTMNIKKGINCGDLVLHQTGLTANSSYNIPIKYSEAIYEHYHSLKTLAKKMDDYWREIQEKHRDMINEADCEIKKSKNKIFNDGVEKGKQLLFQLNEGSISETDFAKSIKRY